MDSSDYIHQLPDGRFVLASFIPCADEWYALPVNDDDPISAVDVEGLPAAGATTYATREEAEVAASEL